MDVNNEVIMEQNTKNDPKNPIFQNFVKQKKISFSCPKDPSVQKLGS